MLRPGGTDGVAPVGQPGGGRLPGVRPGAWHRSSDRYARCVRAYRVVSHDLFWLGRKAVLLELGRVRAPLTTSLSAAPTALPKTGSPDWPSAATPPRDRCGRANGRRRRGDDARARAAAAPRPCGLGPGRGRADDAPVGRLGWQDVRRRYRRSVLGPCWITISMALTVALLGTLYGTLFGVPSATICPAWRWDWWCGGCWRTWSRRAAMTRRQAKDPWRQELSRDHGGRAAFVAFRAGVQAREPLIKSRKLGGVLPGVMARRGEAVWREPHTMSCNAGKRARQALPKGASRGFRPVPLPLAGLLRGFNVAPVPQQ